MASNLACVGLGVADEAAFDALVDAAFDRATPLGTADGVDLHRWEDPGGARLLFGVRDGEGVDLLPSYAGTPGARLDGLRPVNATVWVANVDAPGRQGTMVAAEVEEARTLRALLPPWSGDAVVVAFGSRVTVHADRAAFEASPWSLLDPSRAGQPPPDGWPPDQPWPTRMAHESFVASGAFGPDDEATADARLCGTVLRAERRRTELTGQEFVVARVRTVGFEADLCLAADEHDAPAPGAVVSGYVYLVLSTGVLPVG